MSQARIKALYELRMRALAEARYYVVQYENERFEPPNNARPEDNVYLKFFVLPSRTTSETLDGDHRAYRGVLQASIVGPKGLGKGFATPIIDVLESIFPVNLRLTDVGGLTVQIVSPISEEQAIEGETTYTVPLSCFYRSDTF